MIELEGIIKGCKNEDPIAMERFYYRFGPLVKGICYRYAPSLELKEDMFHDVLLDLFIKIKRYRGNSPFEAWLKVVVINSAIDYSNRFRREKKKFQETIPLFYSDMENALLEDQDGVDVSKLNLSINDLLEMIDGLPFGFRTVFNLYVIDGYSHKEIAKMLKISESTSKSQLSRAKAFLRKMIQGNNTLFQSGEETR